MEVSTILKHTLIRRRPLTVFQDLILVSWLGAVMAWLTSPEELGLPFFERRSFWRLQILYGLAWLPIAVYLLVAHFSWSYWYYVREEDLTPGLRTLLTVLPLVGEYFIALGSYTLFALFRDRSATYPTLAVASTLGVLTLLFFWLPRERYLYIGTANDYEWGKAVPLFSTPSSLLEWGAIGLWFTAIFVPILLGSLREYRQASRVR